MATAPLAGGSILRLYCSEVVEVYLLELQRYNISQIVVQLRSLSIRAAESRCKLSIRDKRLCFSNKRLGYVVSFYLRVELSYADRISYQSLDVVVQVTEELADLLRQSLCCLLQ